MLARHRPRPSHARRPRLEALEDRCVPTAILWVNRGADFLTPAQRVVVDQAVATWQAALTAYGYPVHKFELTVEGGADLGGILGFGGTSGTSQGRPTSGSLTLHGNPGGGGWFVDPTPWDNAEFPNAVTPTYFTGGPGNNDFYSTVLHEMGHTLGFSGVGRFAEHIEPANGGAVYRGAGGLVAALADPGHLSELYHAGDLMTPVQLIGSRTLPSDLDLRLLVDAYRGPAVTPVVGDWDGDGRDTPGYFEPEGLRWGLRNSASAGAPDVGPFTFHTSVGTPVPGDWDGNGTTTTGAFSSGSWTLWNVPPDPNNFFTAPPAIFDFGGFRAVPVVGDWDGDGDSTVGVFDPFTATFALRNSNDSGAPDAGVIQFGGPGVIPVAGDWDGDGDDTIGIYDPRTGLWFLKNANAPGAPDLVVRYGGPGAAAAVGDWDGDGKDTIGIWDEGTAAWLLRNSNSEGAPEVAPFVFGIPGPGDYVPPLSNTGFFDSATGAWWLRERDTLPFLYGGAGWTPVTGDWDGDGDTTVGVFDPFTATFALRNSNSPGFPDAGIIQFGGFGVIPVAGDWDGDGDDTIGIYDPRIGTWFLKNTNAEGPPDLVLRYGGPGTLPVVGDWNGDGRDTIGLFDYTLGTWFLKNSNSEGAPDVAPFVFGGPGVTPVAGDWNRDGIDTIGIYDGPRGWWYARDANFSGPPDGALQYGGPAFLPVTGDWVPLPPAVVPPSGSFSPPSGFTPFFRLADAELFSAVAAGLVRRI